MPLICLTLQEHADQICKKMHFSNMNMNMHFICTFFALFALNMHRDPHEFICKIYICKQYANNMF